MLVSAFLRQYGSTSEADGRVLTETSTATKMRPRQTPEASGTWKMVGQGRDLEALDSPFPLIWEKPFRTYHLSWGELCDAMLCYFIPRKDTFQRCMNSPPG